MLILLLLSGCGNEWHGDTRPVEVPPDAFVVLPCGPETVAPCALVVAGGKRVVFGAPAGAARALSEEDLGQLDAIMMFSLRAADMEGLDELRNRSWHAGRRLPLLVAGPAGTEAVVDGLNAAFENADALRIVDEGMPPGGFDAALLQGYELAAPVAWDSPFDTGDFRVEGQEAFDGHARWRLVYSAGGNDVEILLEPCSEKLPELSERLTSVQRIGCGPDVLATWPLAAPLWLVSSDD